MPTRAPEKLSVTRPPDAVMRVHSLEKFSVRDVQKPLGMRAGRRHGRKKRP
jgi:hypothetical protein